MPVYSRLFPTFSFWGSVQLVLCWGLWYIWTWVLSFVHGDRYGSIWILLHVNIQLCQHNLLKMLSFFYCTIFTSLSKIRCLLVCGLMSGLWFYFMCPNVCFLPIPTCFYYYRCIIESGIVIPPEVPLLYVDRALCLAQSCSRSATKKQTELCINYKLVGLLAQASY